MTDTGKRPRCRTSGSHGAAVTNGHRRGAAARVGLVAALVGALWLLTGCRSAQWCSSGGWRGGGEPATRYFRLRARPGLTFQGSELGFRPDLDTYGCGAYGVPLGQYEMYFSDLIHWPFDFVAVREEDGRCGEVALYCRGVVCRRYTFSYDAAGRPRRRTDIEYEARRRGESEPHWARRFRGRIPPVACVREIVYAWSQDGRTVDVRLAAAHGRRQRFPLIGMPDTPAGEPGEKLETWHLNGQGLITSVVRNGKQVYAAQYNDDGRLLRYQAWGCETVTNRYDARGRIVETHVKQGNGTHDTFAHAYPDAPGTPLPPRKQSGDVSWLVTHDKHGRVCRVRECGGPPDDHMANSYEAYGRDKHGRIVRIRVGFAR